MSRFDEVIDRRNTNSIKYDFKKEYGQPENVIPLWVADMDFRAPKEVVQALVNTAEHGIYGYSQVKEDYAQTIAAWFDNRFGWKPQPEWLVKTPGVVYAINHAIRAYTQPGDGVMIQQPVYHPFTASVESNGRELINNELLYRNGHYTMDYADMEQKLASGRVKLFILCSPHNPVGRVWSAEELQRAGDLCLNYHVPVISDEIHCDFTYPGHTHTVFASLSEELQQNSMICTAPSKTFNLAGLQASNIFIANPQLREKFCEQLRITGGDELNTFALAGCQAAYMYGATWLDELKEYLNDSLKYIRSFLKEQLPMIKLTEPEGTYLLWLDMTGLGMEEKELEEFLSDKAGVWVSSGTFFSPACGQYQRVNMACPRSVLKEAMESLKAAVDARKGV